LITAQHKRPSPRFTRSCIVQATPKKVVKRRRCKSEPFVNSWDYGVSHQTIRIEARASLMLQQTRMMRNNFLHYLASSDETPTKLSPIQPLKNKTKALHIPVPVLKLSDEPPRLKRSSHTQDRSGSPSRDRTRPTRKSRSDVGRGREEEPTLEVPGSPRRRSSSKESKDKPRSSVSRSKLTTPTKKSPPSDPRVPHHNDSIAAPPQHPSGESLGSNSAEIQITPTSQPVGSNLSSSSSKKNRPKLSLEKLPLPPARASADEEHGRKSSPTTPDRHKLSLGQKIHLARRDISDSENSGLSPSSDTDKSSSPIPSPSRQKGSSPQRSYGHSRSHSHSAISAGLSDSDLSPRASPRASPHASPRAPSPRISSGSGSRHSRRNSDRNPERVTKTLSDPELVSSPRGVSSPRSPRPTDDQKSSDKDKNQNSVPGSPADSEKVSRHKSGLRSLFGRRKSKDESPSLLSIPERNQAVIRADSGSGSSCGGSGSGASASGASNSGYPSPPLSRSSKSYKPELLRRSSASVITHKKIHHDEPSPSNSPSKPRAKTVDDPDQLLPSPSRVQIVTHHESPSLIQQLFPQGEEFADLYGLLDFILRALIDRTLEEASITPILLAWGNWCPQKQLLQRIIHSFSTARQPLRLVQIVCVWVNDLIVDFHDEEMFQLLFGFIETLKSMGTIQISWAKLISKTYEESQEVLDEVALGYSGASQAIVSQHLLGLSDRVDQLTILDFDLGELAKQITLLNRKQFFGIHHNEFLNKAYINEKLSPCLHKFTRWFNSVTGWVGTEVTSTLNPKKRVKIITQFIGLALELQKLKNWHSLIAIVSGLSQFAISRLKLTWKSVPAIRKGQFAQLEELVSPLGNFKNLRFAHDNDPPPCILSSTILVKDFTNLSEVSNYQPKNSKTINMHKFSVLAKLMGRIHQVKHCLFDFVEVPVIQSYLSFITDTKWANEEQLEEYSLRIQPSSKILL